jgi:hypothetical protein
MNRRDIVIGGVILLILAGVFYFRSKNDDSAMKVPETKVEASSTEQSMEDKFKVSIPDDAPKAELKSVNESDATGIATRKDVDNSHEVMILADLPDLQKGMVYQGWLVKGNEGQDDYNVISVGRLTSAKGGYMLNYQTKTDYSDHSKVVISEEKPGASKIGTKVLEGNF